MLHVQQLRPSGISLCLDENSAQAHLEQGSGFRLHTFIMNFLSAAPTRISVAALACLLAGAAHAQTSDSTDAKSSPLTGWMFGYSPYTLHYSDAKKSIRGSQTMKNIPTSG